ncbi:E3 SUMO-protein ligase ZBED1-like [Halichoeres trimaculatus]|uniref:E3 SUMO-protein ligase ZBED1-like n=1 Tax=Halichoeres trimaculatus TaxID=147232 RepID=UPI003D9E938D
MATLPRKKISTVWQYFDAADDNKVVCRLCKQKLAYNHSTGAMRNHIHSRHLDVDLQGEDGETGLSGHGGGPRQTSMRAFVPTRRCDAHRTAKITQLICEMTACDMLPLSFVEGKGFDKLMHYIEPEYTVPTRKTITSRLEINHRKMKEEMQRAFEGAEHVAITSDGWTSITTESYMTITCHYVDEGHLRCCVLQTCALEERHTAENLAAHLRSAICTWGLDNKVVACVHDNATNMVLANEALLAWESVPCFAHTLQLAINDGLKANVMGRLIGACTRLVSHFHHSTVATVALKKKQLQLRDPGDKSPPHKLIQSCKTRWNSVLDMFQRLHSERWAITAVLSDRTVTKLTDARTLELTDDNWHTIESMLPVLDSLKTATTALSGETYVSVSLVYPITMSLLNRHLNSAGDLSKVVVDFKKTVAASLERRMCPKNLERAGCVALLASALDPRHKHLSFLSVEMQQAVREKLADQYHILQLPAHVQEEDEEASASADKDCDGPEEEDNTASTSWAESIQHQTKRKKSSLLDFFGDGYGEQAKDHDELERYWLEACIPADEEDPLVWWCEKEQSFPKLSHLAHRYLCVPATSVPAERVFSAAGLIVNRLRSRLTPEHVDMLIALNKNSSFH